MHAFITTAAILAGLGWDNRVSDGKPFDLDASVFLLGSDGKCASDAAFIFYNNKESTDGSVKHHGDNRTGEGDGGGDSPDWGRANCTICWANHCANRA